MMIGDAAFQPVAFARETLGIGRDPECDYPLDHPMVSWRHVRISRAPEGATDDLPFSGLRGSFIEAAAILILSSPVGAVAETAGEKHPAPSTDGDTLRRSFGASMLALGTMLAVLLGSVLVFLKMRDVH